jgi:hypothetical protein
MYTLIIWSLLCTSIDKDCETGDYLELPKQYSSVTECTQDGKAWESIKPTNRWACYYTKVKDDET